MIYFIQPTIPHYRESFFLKLCEKLGPNKVKIYCAKSDPLGNTTINRKNLPIIDDGVFIKIPFINAYWIKGISINLKKDDILIIVGNPRIFNIFYYLIYSKISKFKIVWWGQGRTADGTSYGLKIRKYLMNLFDIIVLYTEKEVNEFKLIIKNKKIIGLNNGIDIENINALRKTNEVQAKLLANEIKTSRNIIFIGRLTEKSNMKLLIKSMQFIRPEIGLIIIGDGPEKGNHQEAARNLGLLDRINFIGQLHDEELISRYASISFAFTYPGSVGLSLIHAFALGLPAIIHDKESSHMPEHAALKNGYNGLLFKYNDELSLAQTVNDISQNENEIIIYKKNAIETVANTYNTTDMANRFFEVLKNEIK